MGYHWTLHTLIVGSLAWSFSMLAIAWFFDLLKRLGDRPHRQVRTVPPRPPADPVAAPDLRFVPLTSTSTSSWRPALPPSSPGAETPEELVAVGD
jgi:hypothetical protein